MRDMAPEAYKMLLDAGTEVNFRPKDTRSDYLGRDIFTECIGNGVNEEILKMLLERGLILENIHEDGQEQAKALLGGSTFTAL